MELNQEYKDRLNLAKYCLQPELKKTYEEVKQTFFPGWDSDCQWKLVVDDVSNCIDAVKNDCEGATGYCDSKEKCIYIDPIQISGASGSGIAALIVHELCHAIVDDGHSNAWATEMERIICEAEKTDNVELIGCLVDNSDFIMCLVASAYAEWNDKWKPEHLDFLNRMKKKFPWP